MFAGRPKQNGLLAVLAVAAVLFCPAAAFAAEEGGGSGLPTGDLGQAIAAILIFVGLLAVLGKWAWKPIVRQLEQREQGIAQTIAKAQEREQQAQALLAQYKQRLDEAEGQAAEMMNESRRKGAEAHEKLLAEAKQESHRLVQSAQVEIQQAKTDALRELYDATAQLAVQAAGKIIHKTLRVEDHREILEESLREVSGRVTGSKV